MSDQNHSRPQRLKGTVASDVRTGTATYDGKTHKVTSFRLAVDHGHMEDGKWVEDAPTDFYTVTGFDKMAEQVYKNVRKGQKGVEVYGPVKPAEKWTGRDGIERETVNMAAWDIAYSIQHQDVQVHRGVARETAGVER